MSYKLLFNANGEPAGFVADSEGVLTEEQARNAVLARKENPTAEEIAQAKARQEQEALQREYKRSRAFEYPPITEYIDGVVKGDQAQIDKYIADCLAVKAKYPKPE